MSEEISLDQWQEFFKGDRFSTGIGCRITDVRPGFATVELTVTEDHLNAAGIIQGGALYTLADFAFAVASNSGNQQTIGISTYMDFMNPAMPGNVLTATARELNRTRKLSAVEVTITDQSNQLIARFHGKGYIIDRKMIG